MIFYKYLKRLFHIAIIALSISCAADNLSSINGVIIAENDIERLSDYRGNLVAPDILDRAKKASVLIVTTLGGNQVGVLKTCSGSMIEVDGKRKIISNQHCFAESTIEIQDGKEIKVSTEKILPEACVKTRVYFNFPSQDNEKTQISNCQPGSLRVNYLLDLAIFSLDNTPEKYQPIEIWLEDNIPLNSRVFVIHHPNTTARNKAKLPDMEARAPVKMVTINDCYYKGGFIKESWQNSPSYAYWIKHTCDLQPGSSGSGLLDQKTGKLLAVNRGAGSETTTRHADNSAGVITTTSQVNVGAVAKFIRMFIANEEIPHLEELTEIPGE